MTSHDYRRQGKKSEQNIQFIDVLNRDLEYWRAIASGLHFLGLSLRKCLFAVHKDIVAVWNIPNMDEVHT